MQCRSQPATPPCCLIVEDCTRDQERLTRAVHHAHKDIFVHLAPTVRAARQCIAQFPVSLILMENTLPDGRGVELALDLSQHAQFRCIPVIIATDWPSPFMWHKAKQAGVRHVVAKDEIGPMMIRDVLNMNRACG